MNRAEKICIEIMQLIVKEGYTNQVHEKGIDKAIIQIRGSDQRTLKNWKRALVARGFIEKKIGSVYQINLMNIPQLFVEIVKTDQKQKKLM